MSLLVFVASTASSVSNPCKTRQRPISATPAPWLRAGGCPFWPIESPGAASRAPTMELHDDPIDNESQDLLPEEVPQQQEGEDIEDSDDADVAVCAVVRKRVVDAVDHPICRGRRGGRVELSP